jgi:hypothetical protein
MKACIKCNIEKEITKDNFRFRKRRNDFENVCKSCKHIQEKKLWIKNRNRILEKSRLERLKSGKKPKPRLITTEFQIRSISQYLKAGWNNQNLPYKTSVLRAHIESLFEPWMNWDNLGRYSARKWDDNDPKTWKWQVDHIIPYSELPYVSKDDDNFKKCWALENIRPYCAKKNCLEGVNRTRHTNKQIIRIVRVKQEPKKYDKEEVEAVKELYLIGHKSRVIAKKLNFTRHKVDKIIKELGIKVNIRYIKENQKCIRCNKVKEINEFEKSSNFFHKEVCKFCDEGFRKIKYVAKYYEDDDLLKIYKDRDYNKMIEAIKILDSKKKNKNKLKNTNN